MGSTIKEMSKAAETSFTVDDVVDELRDSLAKLRRMKRELDEKKAARLDDLVGEMESEVDRLGDAGTIIVTEKVELTDEEIDRLTYAPIIERRKRGFSGNTIKRAEIAEELEEEFPFLRDV